MMASNHPMTGPGGIRKLVARWVITGDLILDSATHLGNGQSGAAVDMVLVRDRAENKPLLSGASLAGGLRSYLLDCLEGYAAAEQGDHTVVPALLGGARRDDEGSQSSLIVFDSLGSLPQGQTAEIRDGVAIQAKTGIAEDHKTFDLEVLPHKTKFPIRFELLIADTKEEKEQISLLVAALGGLEEGEIPIGARRSRGLGACRAINWRVKRFSLETRQGWLEWLGSDHLHPIPESEPGVPSNVQAVKTAFPEITLQNQQDNRKRIRIKASLKLHGGLLVRSPGTGCHGC